MERMSLSYSAPAHTFEICDTNAHKASSSKVSALGFPTTYLLTERYCGKSTTRDVPAAATPPVCPWASFAAEPHQKPKSELNAFVLHAGHESSNAPYLLPQRDLSGLTLMLAHIVSYLQTYFGLQTADQKYLPRFIQRNQGIVNYSPDPAAIEGFVLDALLSLSRGIALCRSESRIREVLYDLINHLRESHYLSSFQSFWVWFRRVIRLTLVLWSLLNGPVQDYWMTSIRIIDAQTGTDYYKVLECLVKEDMFRVLGLPKTTLPTLESVLDLIPADFRRDTIPEVEFAVKEAQYQTIIDYLLWLRSSIDEPGYDAHERIVDDDGVTIFDTDPQTI